MTLMTEAYAKESIVIPYEGTIVLDPGHGGHDQGAQGPDGTLEKTITLSLARQIAEGLNQSYRVVLTRTDDYWLDIADRTAVANHEKAKLFISLHTGGSFLHQAAGMAIYYFEETYNPQQVSEGMDIKLTESGEQAIPWDNVQKSYVVASLKFGKFMQNFLSRQTGATYCSLLGAPLMLLRGMNMPGIMIEVGYVTNPVDEKMFRDPEALKNIAKIISNGINEFLEQVNP